MSMKLLREPPPNYEQVCERFPIVRGRRGVIFCYGDTIFAPYGANITPEIEAHEQVHSTRQGDNVEGWWTKYLADTEFRFLEEMLAHQAEFQKLCEGAQFRQQRRQYQRIIAEKLCSPIYGRMVTMETAKRYLKATTDDALTVPQ